MASDIDPPSTEGALPAGGAPPTQRPLRCQRHRRRSADGLCVSCARPICRACSVLTRVGVKCRRCAGVRWAPPPLGRWLRAALPLLLTLGVAATLVALIVSNLTGPPTGTRQPRGAPSATASPSTIAPTSGANVVCGENAGHQMC